jgi:hypothetical protein
MRHNERTPRLLVGMVVLLLISTVAWAQAPMLTDQPTDDDIQTFVTYWAQSLADANDSEGVTNASGKLTQAFNVQSASRYTFAKLASEELVDQLGTLDANDPLLDLKRVNTAMVIAQMPQVAIQNALQTLIVNDSAAVRYQGWVGYEAIRTLILSQGGGAMTEFHADIKSRLASETDPQVLNAIFDVMALPGFRPESLPADVYATTAATFLTELTANLPTYTKGLYTSDAEWSDACGSAIATTARLLALVQDTTPEATLDATQLQSVMDMMTVAAEVYAQIPVEADQLLVETDQLLVETETVLRECEDLLNTATGLRSNLIAVAIAEDESRQTATPLATIAWTKLLTDFGVTSTSLDEFAPTPEQPEQPEEDAAE